MSAPAIGVLGLGNFGATVARTLASFGHHVIGLDISDSVVGSIADDLAQAVIADAKDEEALRDAGIDQCDIVVIAMGDDLEANLVTAMNVRVLGIRNVWVKSRSRTHQRILSKIGVDHVINPEQEMGFRIAQRIHNPHVADYMSVGGGQTVVALAVPEIMIGKPAASLPVADTEIIHLGTQRAGKLIEPKDHGLFEADDVLILMGRRGRLQNFGEKICG